MKKLSIIIAAVVMIAGFSTKMMAQTNTENTTAGAKIVSALTISEVTALHFGTMTIPTGAVNVILTTGTSRSASIPANITLLAQAPIPANATYTVAGSADATYAITLPLDGVVTISNGTPADNMHVNTFKARATSKVADGLTGTLNGSGADGISVGATLELASGQSSGLYSGTFDITVNYN